MAGLTIKLSASELIIWAEATRWFYPATMKLSTYIALRKDHQDA